VGQWVIDLEQQLVADFNYTKMALTDFEHELEDLITMREEEELRLNEERLRWEHTFHLLEQISLAARGTLTPDLVPVPLLQQARAEAAVRLPAGQEFLPVDSTWDLYQQRSKLFVGKTTFHIVLPIDVVDVRVWNSELLTSSVVMVHRTCASWHLPALQVRAEEDHATLTAAELALCHLQGRTRLCPQQPPLFMDPCVSAVVHQSGNSGQCSLTLHHQNDALSTSSNYTTICNVGNSSVVTRCPDGEHVYTNLNQTIVVPTVCEVKTEHHFSPSRASSPSTEIAIWSMPPVIGGDHQPVIQQLRQENIPLHVSEISILRQHQFDAANLLDHPGLSSLRPSLKRFQDFSTLLRPIWGYTLSTVCAVIIISGIGVCLLLGIRTRKRLDIQEELTRFYSK
jgi:hypothetical protein